MAAKEKALPGGDLAGLDGISNNDTANSTAHHPVLPWRKHFPDRALADSTTTDVAAIGARVLAEDHYWKTGPLPIEDSILAGRFRLSRKQWYLYRDFILAEFRRTPDGWVNPKLDADRVAALGNNQKTRKAREAKAQKAVARRIASANGAGVHHA